jgi:hypothetical protein
MFTTPGCPDALSAPAFLSQVGARNPIDDVSYELENHGRSTHLVRWMMIALWFEKHSKLTQSVIALYKDIG